MLVQRHPLIGATSGSLLPSARLTLVWLAVNHARYPPEAGRATPLQVARTILPGMPPSVAPIGMLYGEFEHYPNLLAVSLRDHGLGDVPRGLLDLASRTRRIVPPTRVHRGKGLREIPPPVHYLAWDLSDNDIEDLSVETLISLVWFGRPVPASPESTSHSGSEYPVSPGECLSKMRGSQNTRPLSPTPMMASRTVSFSCAKP